MAKKRLISSILLCAFAVLFAHSIVPHHHHEEASVTHQTSYYDDEDYDLDNNYLGQVFSNFQHETNGGITYQIATPTFQCLKLSIYKEAILVTQYFIRQLLHTPLLYKEHIPLAFTPSIYSASGLFRGPPSFINI